MNKFFVAFLFLLISCQNSPPQNINAVAVIQPSNGYNARGNVLFEQDGAEVIIKVNISGLNSNSYHGFHIHEFGDIRSQDGKSAGGHYNPDGFPHALPPIRFCMCLWISCWHQQSKDHGLLTEQWRCVPSLLSCQGYRQSFLVMANTRSYRQSYKIVAQDTHIRQRVKFLLRASP